MSEQAVGAPGFRQNAGLMLAGAICSQGLVLLAMPALTRLYPPEAVGVHALFVSVTSALVVLATLRLDLAVILPREEPESLRLVGMVVYQAAAVALALTAVAALGHNLGQAMAPDVDDTTWVWLFAPMVVAGAMSQTGIGMATRHGRFGTIVLANLMLSAVFCMTAVVIGLLSPFENGVVLARLVGQVASVLVLVAAGQLMILKAVRGTTLRRARRLWHEQRQFLVFNTPYSIIGAFARDFPLYVFALSGGAALTASYALARTITLAPTTLASAALSSVFYREAAAHFGTPRLERLAARLTKWGLLVSAPAFALLLIWGDRIFAIAFGSPWFEAGEFAQRLAIPLWLALQTGWPERMFEVARKQNVSFAIQITFDALQAAIVFLTFRLTGDALFTVSAYAMSYSAYQLTYLFAVYRVAGFASRALLRMIVASSVYFAGLVGVFAVVRVLCGQELWPGLTISVAIVLAVSGLAVGTIVRERRRGVSPASPTIDGPLEDKQV